jgi:hypothetical protein
MKDFEVASSSKVDINGRHTLIVIERKQTENHGKCDSVVWTGSGSTSIGEDAPSTCTEPERRQYLHCPGL